MKDEINKKSETEAYPKYDRMLLFNSNVTDEEFIELCTKFSNLASAESGPTFEQIAFISQIKDRYRLPDKTYGLLFPVKRTIGENTYEFGFKPEITFQVDKIVNTYVKFHLSAYPWSWQVNLEERLSNCATLMEQIELLELEMAKLTDRISLLLAMSREYKESYENQKLKTGQWYTHNGNLWIIPLPNKYLDERILDLIVFGATDRKMEATLREYLDKAKGTNNIPYEHNPHPPEPLHTVRIGGRGGGDMFPPGYESEVQPQEIRNGISMIDEQKTTRVDFDHIFFNRDSYSFCLELLEHLGVMENNMCVLKPTNDKKAGRLFAAIVALKQTPKMFKSDYTEENLLQKFNSYLKTSFTQIKKSSNEYVASLDDSERFIKTHFLKK